MCMSFFSDLKFPMIVSPEQGFLPQLLNCTHSPTQSRPPVPGLGLLHLRSRRLTAWVPQVTVQCDHWDQGEKLPSTEIQIAIGSQQGRKLPSIVNRVSNCSQKKEVGRGLRGQWIQWCTTKESCMIMPWKITETNATHTTHAQTSFWLPFNFKTLLTVYLKNLWWK